jgi:hypothetical protein
MARLTNLEQSLGESAPEFVRDSSQGMVTSHDPSGIHPHLLVFCPTLEGVCHDYVEHLQSNRGEYERLQAQILVITAGQQTTSDLPFPIVSEAEDLFGQYGLYDEEGKPHAALIGIGRYGTLESYAAGPTELDLPEEQPVLSRLSSAENLCPECGVPEELWEAAEEELSGLRPS